MQVPDRASATVFGNAERGGIEAFCDVARLVHAKKKEGNPRRPSRCGWLDVARPARRIEKAEAIRSRSYRVFLLATA